MEQNIRVLTVDAGTGFYRIKRYIVGDFFGPVDCGLHMTKKYNSLNIGVGLMAGSIFPGSNRLIVSGFSPCWGGYYISTMGGAGLVFDNLGINMLSIVGNTKYPSILYLNRNHGEEVEIEIVPVDIESVWKGGRSGVYSLFDYTMERFGDRYSNDPRILATGPAAAATDFGAICSVPINRKELSHVDTWAGRGGFGSKMFQEHGFAAIIYGGTVVDEDFRDRKVADSWFENKYSKKLAAKDLESTAKYRFEEKFQTGGTFGVNYANVGGTLISFNYRTMYMEESERLAIHEKFILNHYLKQFNEETIQPKHQKTCGEPCVAVCKKMNGHFKKDYEPYQAMGPLCGIFDQRAAEKLNRKADSYGFDAISVGGVVSWIMECIHEKLIMPEEVGVKSEPVFSPTGFSVETDSMHNSDIACDILDSIIMKKGILNLEEGARKFARRLSRERGEKVLDLFVYNAFGRKGWMVPNQYWTPGVLSPMAIMGKYYMHYGQDFLPPRELGRRDAERFQKELILDNFGMCRFHRGWAEEMIPEIMGTLYNMKTGYEERAAKTAVRINSRNASVFWESERTIDLIYTFLKRKHIIEGENDKDLMNWISLFEKDKHEAALNYWYEIHKGITETLKEF